MGIGGEFYPLYARFTRKITSYVANENILGIAPSTFPQKLKR